MEKVHSLHKKIISFLEKNTETLHGRERLYEIAQEILNNDPEVRPWEFKKVEPRDPNSDPETEKLIQDTLNLILEWGPLTEILLDPTISEIMVNGLNSFYVEQHGILKKLPPIFENEDEILQIIGRMVSLVGRRIDAASPMVDARLPDGSRVNAIIAPLAIGGPVLTIRKFPPHAINLSELVGKKSLSKEMASFLEESILKKKNIIISGGTGSGKTTMLNAIASLVSKTERIITIEDAAEIRLDHPHLISLESRNPNLEGKGEIPIRLLLKNALRMRPDRIIVGEIRGGEALDMLQAMNTGHPGSLSTVHANASLESLLRIETMALMSNVDLSIASIRSQIIQAVHLIIQVERMSDGSRKIVEISELEKPEDNSKLEYKIKKLFYFDKNQKIFKNS
ncbi:MAG: CpaF family protein [Patescibacteria group bacterium]